VQCRLILSVECQIALQRYTAAVLYGCRMFWNVLASRKAEHFKTYAATLYGCNNIK